jgi:hypothetical protein
MRRYLVVARECEGIYLLCGPYWTKAAASTKAFNLASEMPNWQVRVVSARKLVKAIRGGSAGPRAR